MTPHTTPTDRDGDQLLLLLAIGGAVTFAVAGVWLVAVTSAAWAVVLAVIVVLLGVVALSKVIAVLLDDEGDEHSG